MHHPVGELLPVTIPFEIVKSEERWKLFVSSFHEIVLSTLQLKVSITTLSEYYVDMHYPAGKGPLGLFITKFLMVVSELLTT